MALRRSQVLLLIALAGAAAGIALLALRNPAPPWLPADAEHARVLDADRCLTCHGPGGPVPQSARHPLGRDCARCHVARARD